MLRFVFVLLIIAFLAFVCAAEYFFRFAVVRKAPAQRKRKADAGPVTSTIPPAWQTAIAEGERWLAAQRMEPVSVQSRDGLRLSGRLLNVGSKKTLILFHGYRSTAFRDFSCAAAYYSGMGYNLLLVDQRAHGESEGRYICFGARERFDCVCWAEYVDRRIGGDIFLSGISMGATTVLMAAGETLPASVRGIIADCGFTSPREIMLKVMETDLKLKCRPLFAAVALLIRLRTGFSVQECSTPEAMRNNHIPTLFLHGTDDCFVPCEMTVRAHDACAAEKRMLLIEGAGHGLSYLKEPAACQKALADFLNQCTPEA